MTIDAVEVRVFRVPTSSPEADGTLSWDATTAVVVQARADDVTGTGWSYSSPAAAAVVRDHLADAVVGLPVDAVPRAHEAMRRACRNLGTRGLVGQAISAVDIALWDLAARCRSLPVTALLGTAAESVEVYGSGGFTTYSDAQLEEQVAGWLAAGCSAMKIKIGESWGTAIERDLARVRRLREAAGPDVALMVDANGGYSRGQARRVGAVLDAYGVVWFEEPVSSDDVAGLAVVRDAVRCDVAAGEYAADIYDARALCVSVDCLQLDATRCGGYTGFRAGAAVAASFGLQVSAHCAPALHAPVAAATATLRHVEWFADHVRLEPMLFTGVPPVKDGRMAPSREPGHGMALHPEAGRFEVTP